MTSERDFNISGVYKENVFQLKDWVSRYAPLISDWSLEKRKTCINDSFDGYSPACMSGGVIRNSMGSITTVAGWIQPYPNFWIGFILYAFVQWLADVGK